MRYIPLEKLRVILGEEKFNEWIQLANQHLTNLQSLSKQERSEYFRKHGDWTENYIYTALSKLSHHKCWYSEAPDNSTGWDIDHFRPKNRAKHLDGSILLEEGYWWLGYDLNNYRLCGSLVNRRWRDKFNPEEEVTGKGDYFPLKIEECTPVQPNGDLDYEIPYLLDPTVFHDTTLLAFDENGEPFPTHPEGTFEYTRVLISIEYLGLAITQLNRRRKEVWENCEKEIKAANVKLKNTLGGTLRQKVLRDCYEDIRKLADADRDYSSVAKSCITVYAENGEYGWLRNVLRSL
ncbi:hypothetical protein QNI19_38505 [Cytophagaceae bacterium DM2B3-1]|uniref:HNH nuclease domain-containing protein n=1 Tax=Xanthocytophaga flava TaxID=3048013 RepID=A0ABT7CYP8_9BACT|nr:hypothetical protein [Xanthocytophaga flavus]MDJ1498883.1 hypothetical protein [Xanthocytophaga flavus]